MDNVRMQGLLDAIDAESKQASPSHNNLARLVHMALFDISIAITLLKEAQNKPETTQTPTAPRRRSTKG